MFALLPYCVKDGDLNRRHGLALASAWRVHVIALVTSKLPDLLISGRGDCETLQTSLVYCQ